MHSLCRLAGSALILAFLMPAPGQAASADQPASAIAGVVSHVMNAVVRIVVVHRAESSPSANPKLAQGDDGEPMTAIGSGFFIDPSGLVATNRHVVQNAQALFVATPDGGRYRARIAGLAGKADIALLKIEAPHPWPAVSFGDSDALHVGDSVIAIGSPFGFDNSVTAGIVSSINRNIMESPYDDYIQTDAAINHGNSGGPLFNLKGEVVGMNSVLFAPGQYTGSAGVGFAIPSNDLSFVFQRMEKYGGKVHAGMLPIRTQQVSELMAQAIGAPDASGALVIAMTGHADQMKGAIEPGDVIRGINGETVTDPRDFARKTARADIGSTARLDLWRAGKNLTVTVPILPLDAELDPPRQPDPPPHVLGLHFDAAPAGHSGVVITSIDREGSAADSGLKPGDIVVEIQRQAVTTPDEATLAMAQRRDAGQRYCALLVERDGQQSWIPVALPSG